MQVTVIMLPILENASSQGTHRVRVINTGLGKLHPCMLQDAVLSIRLPTHFVQVKEGLSYAVAIPSYAVAKRVLIIMCCWESCPPSLLTMLDQFGEVILPAARADNTAALTTLSLSYPK
jgi:hypothetical protein